MSLLELIEGMPMFASFSEDEKKTFAEMEHTILKFSKNDDIIMEGEPSRSLYLLVEGTCLITKTVEDVKIRLSKLSSGEIFGEMSYFSGKPRQSTVTATGDVKVLKIENDFIEKAAPAIRDRINDYFIKLLVSRLDHMNAAIMKISRLMVL
ncbi:Crp/Fnr family transcriptional regulator [Thermodesulfobacteriota bacterium]